MRLLIAEVLRELGYSCLEANDVQSALPILRSNVRLDLMVTDVGLPGLNGRQLAEIARQHRPDLQVLFVTGYAEHAVERAGFLEPGMEMVSKPFTLATLRNAIVKSISSIKHERGLGRNRTSSSAVASWYCWYSAKHSKSSDNGKQGSGY